LKIWKKGRKKTVKYLGSSLSSTSTDWVFIPEFFQVKESVVRAEILKLDQELGEYHCHLVHKFLHELGHDIT
jgi:hypothetical protein